MSSRSRSGIWSMHMTDNPEHAPKGTMLFDGDCGFCRKWIRRWAGATGERIRYEPYQKVLQQFPEVTEAQCREAVQLILNDRSVYTGAHAVFKALSLAGRSVWLLRLYEGRSFFHCLAEWLYRLVARHRPFFSKLIRKNE
jgi:predicted DCC family thiol-disulfide oxidoreductase YuxK